MTANGPLAATGELSESGARPAFNATLSFFNQARATASGEATTFLFDEFLELRTFESFPGLRRVLHELVASLAGSPNRFVLTSRYATRATKALRDHTQRFELIQMPTLSLEETYDMLGVASRPLGKVSISGQQFRATTSTRSMGRLSKRAPAAVAPSAIPFISSRNSRSKPPLPLLPIG